MATQWQFDEKYLSDLIKKSEQKIKNPLLPKEAREDLQTDITLFKQFLTGAYEGIEVTEANIPKNIHSLKRQILKKMRDCYKTLGEEAIDWILYLDEEQFFMGYGSIDETELNAPEQASLALKNYSKISPVYLHAAVSLLYPDGPSKIHIPESLSSSSYCHHVAATKEPILIVDPTETPWIFNHELQHGVEVLLKYKTPYFYTELGPQYIEPFFLERLYEHQGFINTNDYQERLRQMEDRISEVTNYLLVLKLFAQRNFNVSTADFLSILSEYEETPKEQLYPQVMMSYIGNEEESSLMYLLSYLKAVELYEETKDSTKDISTVLTPYINTKKFNYTPPKEGYKVYERYINRMDKLTK